LVQEANADATRGGIRQETLHPETLIMPMFTFSTAVAAGAAAQPLSGWNYRFPPKNALFELIINATGVGMVQNVTTGPESIVQSDSPVSAGGVAGTLPARLSTEPIVDMVNAGEELVLNLRNTSAGTITVNGVAIITYK
jgi:hypothetical protein